MFSLFMGLSVDMHEKMREYVQRAEDLKEMLDGQQTTPDSCNGAQATTSRPKGGAPGNAGGAKEVGVKWLYLLLLRTNELHFAHCETRTARLLFLDDSIANATFRAFLCCRMNWTSSEILWVVLYLRKDQTSRYTGQSKACKTPTTGVATSCR